MKVSDEFEFWELSCRPGLNVGLWSYINFTDTRDVAVRGLGARLAWAVWLEIPGRGVVVCHVNAYTSLNGVTGVTDRRYYPAALSVVSTLL